MKRANRTSLRPLSLLMCVIATLAWTTRSYAQQILDDDQIAAQLLAASAPPNMERAFSPQLHRRDLAMYIEALQLTDSQIVILETLFSDYETSFAQGVQSLRAQLADVHNPADSDAERQRRRQKQLNRQRRMEILREQIQELEQRGELSTEQRAAMIEEAMSDINAQAEIPQADLAARARATIAYYHHVRRVTEPWMEQRARLFDEFHQNLQLLLTAEQNKLWQPLVMRLRREKTLQFGALAGESTDVIKLVESTIPADVLDDSIRDLLARYAEQLDAALIARNDMLENKSTATFDALKTGNLDAVRRMTVSEARIRTEVRDVNFRFVEAVANELDAEHGETLRTQFAETAFPRIYRQTHAERLVRAAMTLDDLGEEQLEDVIALRRRLRDDLAAANEHLYETTVREQPRNGQHELEWEITRLRGDMTSYGDQETPVERAFADRRQIEQRHLARLTEILGQARFAQLVRAQATDASRQRQLDSGGRVSGALSPEQRLELMRRYDADGDGRLSAGERAKMTADRRAGRAGDDDEL